MWFISGVNAERVYVGAGESCDGTGDGRLLLCILGVAEVCVRLRGAGDAEVCETSGESEVQMS